MNDQVTEAQVEQSPEVVVETNEVEKASAPGQNAETSAQDTEASTEEKEAQAVEKTYSQKEYDEATAKIRKKAEAVAERRALKAYAEKLEGMQQKPVEQRPVEPNGKPTIAQFGDNVEAYVEAVADWKMRQRDIEISIQHEARQQAQVNSKAEKLYAEAEKIPGFDVEAFEATLTPAIASVVIHSDIAPKLMAYMSEHPEEMERIANLVPGRQAAEIGKLEVRLQETKQVAKPSKAPAPMKPVGSKGGQVHKPVAEMSLAELRKFEETRGSKFI